MVVFFGVFFSGYHVALEFLLSGKTPGKMVVGLRVLKSNGSKISLLDSFIRNTLRIVDILPSGYLVAMAVMFVEKYNRRLGDLVADTIVIYDRTTPQSLKKYIDTRLMEGETHLSVSITGLQNLTLEEKAIIKNLHERIHLMKPEDKKKILAKFQQKFLQKISVSGECDAQTLLSELYKSI